MVMLQFILFHKNIFGCSILLAFDMDEYVVPVKKRSLAYHRDSDGRKVFHHVKRVLPNDGEGDGVHPVGVVRQTLSRSQFNELPLSLSQVRADEGPLNSTLIPDRDGECLSQGDLPSQISAVVDESRDTPSEADMVILPCGQGSPAQNPDDSVGITDSQLADMGDVIETESEEQAQCGHGPSLPDFIPNSLFEGTMCKTTTLVVSLVSFDSYEYATSQYSNGDLKYTQSTNEGARLFYIRCLFV